MATITVDSSGRISDVLNNLGMALNDMGRFQASPGYSNNGAQEYTFACGMFRMLMDAEKRVLGTLYPMASEALRRDLEIADIPAIRREISDAWEVLYHYTDAIMAEYEAMDIVESRNYRRAKEAQAALAQQVAAQERLSEKLRRTCPYCGKEFAHVGTKDRHVAVSCKAVPEFMVVFKEAFADLNGRAYMTDDAENGMRVQRRCAY